LLLLLFIHRYNHKVNEEYQISIDFFSLLILVSNPCGINNSGCSHLCLLTVNQSYTCACPEHFSFVNDGNNQTCVSNCSCNQHRCDPPNEQFISCGQRNVIEVNFVLFFKIRKIFFSLVNDCENGSDEPSTCSQRRCTPI
jgi:hypothetical protein